MNPSFRLLLIANKMQESLYERVSWIDETVNRREPI